MKKNCFANVLHGEDYIIHNVVNGAVIRAKGDESKAFIDMIEKEEYFDLPENNDFIKALLDMKVIIENDFDEVALVNYKYNQMIGSQLLLLPIVTRQCNFRCVYCYEKHEDKKMTVEIYDNMIKSVERMIDEKGFKRVYISFFGGEPMLEYENIVRFMAELKELCKKKNVALEGFMTSNAYLLTPERLRTLVDLNVTGYQLTVDGLKETHDQNRPLAGGGGTWDPIIKNLLGAKELDVTFDIKIRANYNEEIVDKANEFINYLSKNFTDDKRFTLYFESIKKLGGKNDGDIKQFDDDTSVTMDMVNLAKEINVSVPFIETFSGIFGRICYALRENCYAVDYNGELLKCTVLLDQDKNHIGKINDDGSLNISADKHSQWVTPSIGDKCHKCPVFPICCGRKCINARYNDDICENMVKLYWESLDNMYTKNSSEKEDLVS